MNRQTPNPISAPKPAARKLFCAVAAVLAATAIVHAQAATSATAPLVVAHATTLQAGDAVIGALPANAPMHIVVALRLRDVQGLDAFIASASGSMPHATFLAHHAPTQEQAQAVADFLVARGLHEVTVAPDRMLVSANGPAATVAAAFATSFEQVRTHDGRLAYANADAVRVPAALGDSVLAVVGLQNVNVARLFVQGGMAGGGDPAVAAHDPDAFAAIYGGRGVAAASAVTVGIVAAGSPGRAIADLASWSAQRGLPSTRAVAIGIADATAQPDAGAAWNVASQGLLGMAGNVRELDFHATQDLSAASLLSAYEAIVSQDNARAIVLPFGRCETDAQADGSAAADDALFAAAAAQGQTFVAASGAEAAACAGPAWPAASRYVVAVAGTRLATLPAAPSWVGESSWSIGNGRASGFEAAAPWQMPSSSNRRLAADVAYPGDPASGARILLNGMRATFGGAGLSAALFAGTWARVLQAHPEAGFAGPYLQSRPKTDFHPVSAANPAAVGRGSPVIGALLANAQVQANQPPTAAFTFTSSGLTAHFTDASTDSDGTVVLHKWTFGDGGTAGSISPNHTYAVASTYSVTETVTDDGGASNTVTHAVTVPFFEQLLRNTGFENSSLAPWRITNETAILTDPNFAHGGSNSVLFGGVQFVRTNTVQSLFQSVVIPSGIHSAKLTFWLHITTSESSTGVQDRLRVALNPCGCFPSAEYSNLQANSGYVQEEVDVDPANFGQTLILKFYAQEGVNGNASTKFYVDDVRLTVR